MQMFWKKRSLRELRRHNVEKLCRCLEMGVNQDFKEEFKCFEEVSQMALDLEATVLRCSISREIQK